ncbi:MAG: hypothetical protein KAT17_00595 [Candidatus Aminicenantes bacterium]|nr:hypothetical protein [Candidatus Aminicenantes bacterium]
MPTLYDELKARKKNRIKKPFVLFMAVLGIMIIVRFLNLSLLWQMTKMELNNRSLAVTQNYFFLGLSTYAQAKNRLLNYSDTRTKKIAVVSYYTLLQPAVFLISNDGNPTFIDLGRVAVYIESGLTKITLHSDDIIERQWRNTIQTKFMGYSLFSFLYEWLISSKFMDSKGKFKLGKQISYVVKPIEKTKYLKITYILYFYLPLLLIFWFSSIYGRGFYCAFFYYLGIFLLFNFKRVLITVPFFWLFNLIKIEISDFISLLFAMALLVIFLILAGIGVKNWKGLKRDSWGKPLIFMFILLPVFLRF